MRQITEVIEKLKAAKNMGTIEGMEHEIEEVIGALERVNAPEHHEQERHGARRRAKVEAQTGITQIADDHRGRGDMTAVFRDGIVVGLGLAHAHIGKMSDKDVE